MLRLFTVIVAVMAVCQAIAIAAPAAGGQAKYSGEWLASELGLNNDQAMEQALGQLKNSKAPSQQDFQASGQIDGDLLAKSKLLQQHVGLQKYQEAVELAKQVITTTISKLNAASSASEQTMLTQFLFTVYLEKIKAHHMLKQSFEALLNGLRMKTLCGKYTSVGCTGQQLHSLQTMMHYIEQVIKTTRPADALGLTPSEVGDTNKMRANRRRIRALLHPDKNQDLDEENAKELERIFNLANVTYEQLLAQSRK